MPSTGAPWLAAAPFGSTAAPLAAPFAAPLAAPFTAPFTAWGGICACAWVTRSEREDPAVWEFGTAACKEHAGMDNSIAAAQRDRHHRAAMVDWKRDIRLSPLLAGVASNWPADFN
jgi:hypothetical protein